MGVMQDRRRIIEAQPHLVTASGETLEINVAERKVEKLEVSFHPVQTGSGTPSPSNPRPVVGWSSIPVSIVPGTSDVLAAVPEGKYGTVDLSTGVMTVTWGTINLGTLNYFTVADGGGNLYRSTDTRGTILPADWTSGVLEGKCQIYTARSGDETYRGVQDYSIGTDGTGQIYIYDSSRNGLTAAQFKSSVSGVLIVCALATPYTVQLSGITPRTGTVTISPFQQGGGTASPTNLRPVIPVAGGVSANLTSTVHSGTLDLVSGTGLVMWNIKETGWSDASAFSSFTKSGDNRIFWIYLGGAVYNDDPLHILSDQYTFAGYGYDYAGVPVYSMCGSPDYTGSLWVKVPASDLPTDNLAGAQAFFQQTLPKFYWPRTVAGRTAFSSTPQTILAPRGQQTVTSPAGAVEISYWTH